MKIKTVKVGVKSLEDSLNEFKDIWKRTESGKDVEKQEALYFEDLETLRAVLTTKRIQLIRAVKIHKPKSIYELAKILKRDIKNVNEDVKLLSSIGLITLKKAKEGRKNVAPIAEYESISLEIKIA